MIIALDNGCKKDNKINPTIILQDNPPGIISKIRFKNNVLFTPAAPNLTNLTRLDYGNYTFANLVRLWSSGFIKDRTVPLILRI